MLDQRAVEALSLAVLLWRIVHGEATHGALSLEEGIECGTRVFTTAVALQFFYSLDATWITASSV
ncbi:hypothetical protein WOLCODRAFT_29305 [Wolfiporia cocos MD-104 SS10]|uniref:Uncharacterized protein n=1 Tax=Wolfiporia cocos (strain MD-104) TaxID=742152 RepID=A0A2H3JBM2_WOLCO|nr:hypothetical protein WOLCODRAFT_29305 [Wolfiporia cocos MD-104 SS10]